MTMISSEQQQTIREAAYHKWEQAGRPHGDGVEFWLESEHELLDPHQPESELEVQDLGPAPTIPMYPAANQSQSQTAEAPSTVTEDYQQETRVNRRSRRRAT
jgi:hypothetical protein